MATALFDAKHGGHKVASATFPQGLGAGYGVPPHGNACIPVAGGRGGGAGRAARRCLRSEPDGPRSGP